ncbi:PIG-L family deacetylase [Streptomyces sp. NBC_01142]|uniref:PIG-L family deacetylase n=1 Tax=Streptomyces sp. NBC_01142 TaxID=2975865 RepID=UPI002258161A|nr:PIG-L family deacetylase [Streptomyces sp. NBC_01142]MCX4822633.1 PIG-L family deacetylase [Streptomyces sp. NBC_01142]
MLSSGSRRPALLSRRGLTATLILAPLVGFAYLAGTERASSDAQEAPIQPARPTGASVMQILSHPDDDLFFMNPDTSHSVGSGRSITSVYLTAGESDGVNAASKGPLAPRKRPAANRARYAEARQNGIRAAYAEMATGSRTSPWQRTTIPTAGGGSAELDTLRARPEVNLVWVQLHEAGSIVGDRPDSLHGLWDGRVERLGSQLASSTPVEEDFTYTKGQVVDTIAGLLERFGPTHVRTLDPTPGRNARTGKPSDHQDHTYGARFAQAALAQYAQSPGRPRFSVQNYMGYVTGGLPHTLDPAGAEAKLRTLKTYAWLDNDNYCGDKAGCGDRKVAARPAGHGWAQSIRYTRGESTSWLQPDRDGGLWAFSVLDNRLAVWHREAGAKGEWSGPTLLAGTGIDSGVSSVRLPDGRIAVFATRTTIGRGPDGYRRDVVTAVQRTPDGLFGPWRSLGTPERGDASASSDISAPAVAADSAGRMTVYLRNGRHSLSAIAQRSDGSWGRWRALGGRDLHGDPVVASDATGRRQVFAGTPRSVLTWHQPTPGAPLSGPADTGLPPTTLALSAGTDGDGIRLWFRKPDSGAVRTVLFTDGHASPLRELGGPAGFGPVSASGPDNSLLAARSRTGMPGTAVVAPGAPGSAGRSAQTPGPVTWRAGGSLFAGAPAGVRTGAGAGQISASSTGLAAVGLDGRLYWAQPDGRGSVTAWHPVG